MKRNTLTFGLPTHSYYEIWAPFVTYLNDHLPGIHVQAVTTPNFLTYIDRFNERFYDFALGNAIWALDSARLGYSILGTSIEEDGNIGVILVNKDSLINGFSDLKGKSVASVGDPGLAGHMLPVLYLHNNGVNVNKDIKVKHVDSFESVILGIYLGKFSAGFTSLNVWNNFLKKRPELATKVSKKWQTEPVVGNSLMIRSDVSKETVSQLRSVILSMHLNERGQKALAEIGYEKFIPSDSNGYAYFRNLVREYQKLSADQEK